MPIDLNSGNINENIATFNDNTVENNAVENTTGINKSNQINNNCGIEAVDTVNEARNASIFEGKNTLQRPKFSLSQLASTEVPIDPEMQSVLGVESDFMPLSDFVKTLLEKLYNEQDNAIFCMLLCQKAKSVFVDVLKNILKAKTGERQALSKEYMEKQNEIASEQLKSAEEFAKARKRAIGKAVMNAFFAVVGCVFAALAVIATAGAATPLLVCAVAGALCAGVSASLSIASAGVTIGALTTNDNEKAEKLNKANQIIGWVNMGVGIVGAGFSIVGGIYSLAKNVEQTVKTVFKVIEIISGVADGASGAVCAAFGIMESQATKRRAELEKVIATLQIAMTEMDKVIEFLTKFIDAIKEDLQYFIDLILKSEQMAGSEIIRSTDAQTQVGDNVGVHA